MLATVINQSAVHWRTNVVDSDLFAYYGWCVSVGARPYLDIWDNKPPGIWWLNAAAVRLCGPGVAGELLLGSAAVLTALLAFVGIARTAFHQSLLLPAALVGVVLLTHLRFECGSNRTETFVVTCETVAVLGYLRWLRTRRYAGLLLAGLAAGAAPLFKQSGIAVAVAGALHLAWVQWRAPSAAHIKHTHPLGWKVWVIAGGALAIPSLTAAAVLASQGALREVGFAVGAFNQAYFAVGDATWLRLDRALHIYRPVLEVLTGMFVIAGIGLAWGAGSRWWRGRLAGDVRRQGGYGFRISDFALRDVTGPDSQSAILRPPPRRGIGLFFLWFLLAVYLACVGPGRRGHHLMPALPALGLLVLYPLHLLAARRGLRACLTARPGALSVVVVWVYVLGALAVGSLNEATRCWRTKPHWYALRRSRPAPYELQAGELVRLTRPTDTIYVWGWSPGTYRYAYRRPASRYATFEKLGQVGPHAHFILAGAIADIRRNPPKAVVISINDYEGLLAAPRGDFAAWLQPRYELADTIEGMHILIRRDHPP